MLYITASYFPKYTTQCAFRLIPVITNKLAKIWLFSALFVFWKYLPAVDFKDAPARSHTQNSNYVNERNYLISHGPFQVHVCTLVFWKWLTMTNCSSARCFIKWLSGKQACFAKWSAKYTRFVLHRLKHAKPLVWSICLYFKYKRTPSHPLNNFWISNHNDS